MVRQVLQNLMRSIKSVNQLGWGSLFLLNRNGSSHQKGIRSQGQRVLLQVIAALQGQHQKSTRGLGLITHLRTSNQVSKTNFKNLFKADTWRAHGELRRHLLSVIYLSKVRLISGFALVSCTTKMQINKVTCFKRWMGGWKSRRGGWRTEAQFLFIICKGQMSDLSVWSGSVSAEDADCRCRSRGRDGRSQGCYVAFHAHKTAHMSPKLRESDKVFDSIDHRTKDGGRLRRKSHVKHFNLFFCPIWNSAVNRRFEKANAKGPRWERAGKTFHFCLNWNPLRRGSVFDSYHHRLSLRGQRQKWYPTILLEWQTLGNEWQVLSKHFLSPLSACSCC